MTLDITAWTHQLQNLLSDAFGSRIRFLGLQGSYGRGEPREESDIDIVFILDTLYMDDLDRYRATLRQMPQWEKACGFVCGESELFRWPRYDLFSLLNDTRPITGALAPLLPEITREDIRESVRIGASNLYHGACHIYLYDAQPQQSLPDLHKSAFFVLRALHCLRTGSYLPSARALLPHLEGVEHELLQRHLSAGAVTDSADVSAQFAALTAWSGELLKAIDLL